MNKDTKVREQTTVPQHEKARLERNNCMPEQDRKKIVEQQYANRRY